MLGIKQVPADWQDLEVVRQAASKLGRIVNHPPNWPLQNHSFGSPDLITFVLANIRSGLFACTRSGHFLVACY